MLAEYLRYRAAKETGSEFNGGAVCTLVLIHVWPVRGGDHVVVGDGAEMVVNC